MIFYWSFQEIFNEKAWKILNEKLQDAGYRHFLYDPHIPMMKSKTFHFFPAGKFSGEVCAEMIVDISICKSQIKATTDLVAQSIKVSFSPDFFSQLRTVYRLKIANRTRSF